MEKPKCPHCGVELLTVETPMLSGWYGTELEMCLNDMCDYFLNSWKVLFNQTGVSAGYRYAQNGGGGAVLVASPDTFKDCIVSDEDRKQRDEEIAKKEKEFKDLMTAIEHAEEIACSSDNEACREEHAQLAMWLKQLKKVKYPRK